MTTEISSCSKKMQNVLFLKFPQHIISSRGNAKAFYPNRAEGFKSAQKAFLGLKKKAKMTF